MGETMLSRTLAKLGALLAVAYLAAAVSGCKSDGLQCKKSSDCASGFVCVYGGCFKGGLNGGGTGGTGGDTTTPTDTSTGDTTTDTTQTTPTPSWNLGADESLLVVVGGEASNDVGIYRFKSGDGSFTRTFLGNLVTGSTAVAGVPGMNLFVAADGGQGKIWLVEVLSPGESVKVHHTAMINAGLADLAVTPDGTRVLVVQGTPPNSTLDPIVSIVGIDLIGKKFTTRTDVKVGRNPRRIAIHPSGSWARVTNGDDGTLSLVDLSTDPPTAKLDIDTPASQPYGIAISPDGSTLTFVTGENDSIYSYTVNGVDLGLLAGPTPVGTTPAEIVYAPGGSLLFVADIHSTPAVHVMKAEANNSLTLALSLGVGATGGGPHRIGVEPSGKVVVALDQAFAVAYLLDIATDGSVTKRATDLDLFPNAKDFAFLKF